MAFLTQRQKITFYRNLRSYLQAGLSLPRAVQAMQKKSRHPRWKKALATLRRSLEQNSTIAEAFARAGVSPLESHLLAAGENAGAIAPICEHLENYFLSQRETRQRATQAMLYPLLLLHLGIVLPLIPEHCQRPHALLQQIALHLGALYLGASALAIALALSWKASTFHPGIDRLWQLLPGLGPLKQSMALNRFCLVFAAALRASSTHPQALRAAALASRSARIAQASQRLIASTQRGEPLAEEWPRERAFPEELSDALAMAEESGNLDREMQHWAELLHQRSQQRLKILTEWIPRLLYLGIVLYVGWKIIALYREAFAGVQKFL